MKRWKRTLAMVTAAAMTLPLVACGGSGASATTAASAESTTAKADAAGTTAESGTAAADTGLTTEDITLTMSWWGGDARHEATQKALEAFTAKHPNIKIEPVFSGWSGWEEKMGLAFSQGTAEDVIQMGSTWHEMYDNDGTAFYDLYQVKDILDLTQFDNVEAYEVNGKLNAVPVSMTARVMFWNKATFEKAGIEIPTTWDELIASGATFQEKLGDDYYPMMLNPLDRAIFMVWYLESKYGKEWISDDTFNYTEEELADGFDMISMLEEKHVMPTLQEIADNAANPVEQSPVWVDGRWAGVYTWNTSPEPLRTALPNPDDLVVGPMFEGFEHKGGFYKASMLFGISQNCEHPKEAAALLNFLLNEPEGVTLMGTQRGIPYSKAGLKVLEEQNAVDPLIKEATDLALEWNQVPMDSYFESSEFKATTEGLYDRVYNALSYKEIDSAEAAKIFTEEINAKIASSQQ